MLKLETNSFAYIIALSLVTCLYILWAIPNCPLIDINAESKPVEKSAEYSMFCSGWYQCLSISLILGLCLDTFIWVNITYVLLYLNIYYGLLLYHSMWFTCLLSGGGVVNCFILLIIKLHYSNVDGNFGSADQSMVWSPRHHHYSLSLILGQCTRCVVCLTISCDLLFLIQSFDYTICDLYQMSPFFKNTFFSSTFVWCLAVVSCVESEKLDNG